jgi:quercetin dioxygenase-like cupin family protein
MTKLVTTARDPRPAITPEGAERRVLSHGGSMMAVEFTFPAGVSAPLHSHPHEQIGYVVSGELDLVMDGVGTVRLTAGSSYYVPPNVRHGVIIHTPTILLDCFTPQREDFLPAEPS